MPLFSRKKDKSKKSTLPVANGTASQKPRWEDSWLRTRVDPEEVSELLHGCTKELKSRALDVPFLLLPFRPSSDPSAARTFVRNYFFPPGDRKKLAGESLMRELRMTEVMVIIAVVKWCWARLPGGVVTWEAYHGFKVGEADSQYARDAFNTFIPISVESSARLQIITDFFDLMTALAAHGKTNGFGGYKLSRYSGWWAFDHYDTGKGFEAGYRLWSNAADATCHLFFAYLRSQTPEPGKTNGVLELPRSLQHLVEATHYPPTTGMIVNDTTKVVMIVDVVSPTPFALLRRAKQFEYRDDDAMLQRFSNYEDPVEALTEECRRVLKAISSANQSQVSDAQTSTSLKDPSWSRFEDIGFSSAFDETEEDSPMGLSRATSPVALNTTSRSGVIDLNRPTTPSWADFLSTGFADENGNKAPSSVLLPPDKAIPPIATTPRGQSSQSHRRDLETNSMLEPGELASIGRVNLDDAFWWVWVTSLAGEEPTSRKAAFGRCALIETTIVTGQWMIMEEQVKGAAPEPAPGAYVAERKSFFSFTKRGRLTRRRSGLKKSPLSTDPKAGMDMSNRLTLEPDRQARIQKAAAELSRKNKLQQAEANGSHKGLTAEERAAKTNSVYTMGPMIKDEVSPALQWAKQYDKKAIREQYLGNELAGKGSSDFLGLPNAGMSTKKSSSSLSVNKTLPTAPEQTVIGKPSTPSPEPKRAETNGVHNVVTVPLEQKEAINKSTKPEPEPETITALPSGIPAVNEAPKKQEVEAPLMKETSQPRPEKTEPILAATSAANRRSSDANDRSKLSKKGLSPPPSSASNKPSGIKRLFGTKRKNKEEVVTPAAQAQAPAPAPAPARAPVEENPAIAAARRALEGKPANPNDTTASPPLSPSHFAKYKNSKAATGAARVAAVPEAAKPSSAATVKQQNIPQPETTARSDDEPTPPRTRRDEEFDQLSRVDTTEKEDADREFSRFDQGPLTEQPAFAPEGHKGDDEDSPHQFEPPHRPQHQSVYSAMSLHTDGTDEEMPDSATQQVNAQDRWAQIRKNAADRAARASEDHARSRTETRTTDDGETSGEETIESRVARIKARVAELTGNMENARR